MRVPANKSAPVMTGAILRPVIGRLARSAKSIRRSVLEIFRSIPYQKIDTKTGVVVNVDSLFANREIRYEYTIDSDVLAAMSLEIERILNQEYLDSEAGQSPSDWFMYSSVNASYTQGTTRAIENLASQTSEYFKTPEQEILSSGFARRVGFIRARVFENMKGLTDESRTDLADTLARGMAAGESPMVIAREVRKRVGVSFRRAKDIARTEINEAHRKAQLAEDEYASETLGLRTGMLHFSALSPTTRHNHGALHGSIRTRQEVREWYNKNGNAINCKCSQQSVILDSSGEPLDKRLIERMKKEKEVWFEN